MFGNWTYVNSSFKIIPLLNNMTNCAVEVTIVHYYWIKLVTKNRKNTKWSSLSSFWENMRVFGTIWEYCGEYLSKKALYGLA